MAKKGMPKMKKGKSASKRSAGDGAMGGMKGGKHMMPGMPMKKKMM